MKVSERLEHYRVRVGPYASDSNAPYGAFEQVPGPCGAKLFILADDGELSGWQHVSVSCKNRCPNWPEMCFVKDLFWDAEDCVVQYHPPASQYVNNYPHVLHLWRPKDALFPMPDSLLVGLKGKGEVKDPEEALEMQKEAEAKWLTDKQGNEL